MLQRPSQGEDFVEALAGALDEGEARMGAMRTEQREAYEELCSEEAAVSGGGAGGGKGEEEREVTGRGAEEGSTCVSGQPSFYVKHTYLSLPRSFPSAFVRLLFSSLRFVTSVWPA